MSYQTLTDNHISDSDANIEIYLEPDLEPIYDTSVPKQLTSSNIIEPETMFSKICPYACVFGVGLYIIGIICVIVLSFIYIIQNQ